MDRFILFVIGLGMGYWLAKYKFKHTLLDKGHEPRNREQTERRDENLAKVMDIFISMSEITNDDVSVALGVSDTTATRYLDELENAGKIRQIGQRGAGVKYVKI